MLRPLTAVALALALTACVERVPPTRGEVVGVADALQQSLGQAWGDPVEVLPPPTHPDIDGRRWWQLRYASAADGARRVILVDDDSRWARLPPPGWRLRLASRPADARSATNAVASLRADPGSWIVMVTAPEVIAGDRLAERERLVIALNAAAARDGLLPLFSLRADAARRQSVIYGWQGDSGIARDERLRHWIDRQLGGSASTTAWVDLAAAMP